MKKLVLLILCIGLLLCGCGTGDAARFADLRETVLAAQKLSFTALVQAEYEDKTAEFTLAFSMEGDEYSVEILEPELVRGMRAHVKSGETHLEYDGAILDIGTLNDRGLCPMSALPFLADAIRSAHLDFTWTENGLAAAQLTPSDGMTVKLWLGESGFPTDAEIIYNEKTVVFISISDWEMTVNERASKEDMG